MNTFWALVGNDLHAKRGRHRNPYRKFYSILAVLLGFGWYTYALLEGFINPVFFFVFTPTLLFVMFALSFFHIHHERKNRTEGWWLSLPYSRKFLLSAKITAIVLRFLRILLSVLLIIFLLELEAAILRPEIWTGDTVEYVILGCIRMLGYMLVMTPMVALFSVTMAVLTGSVWRAAIPLFWVAFIALINLFGATVFKPLHMLGEINPENLAQYHVGMAQLPLFTWDISVIYLLVYIVIVPVILFLLSSLVLDRYTEVK